jgi:hypothetical protein
MTPFENVGWVLRDPEPEEIAQALLATLPVIGRIHGPNEIIVANQPIKGRYHGSDTFFAKVSDNCGFIGHKGSAGKKKWAIRENDP